MNSRQSHNMEGGNIEDVENRVTGLEDDMKLFKTLMIKGKDHDTMNKSRGNCLKNPQIPVEKS